MEVIQAIPSVSVKTDSLDPLPSLRDHVLARDQRDIEPPGAVDRALHGGLAQLTQGFSLSSLALAWMDWGMHLGQSPGKWYQLCGKAWRKDMRWLNYAGRAGLGLPVEPCITPCHRTSAFTIRPGSDGHTTSCIRPSCSTNSGGTTPPLVLTGSASIMRTWWHSWHARCSTWSRQLTLF